MKKKRNQRKKVALILVGLTLIVIALAFYLFGVYRNRIIKAEIDKRLPAIGRKLGLDITIGQVDSNLLSGTRLLNITLAPAAQNNAKPIGKIPEIDISHEILFKPKLHLRIGKIFMENPQFDLQLLPDGSMNFPTGILGGIASGSTGSKKNMRGAGSILPGRLRERVEIPESVEIQWDRGVVDLQEGYFIKAAKPLRLKMNDCRGRAIINLAERTLTLDGSTRFGEDQGRISLHGDLDKKNINLMLTAKDAKLSAFSPYAPEGLLIGKDAIVNGSMALEYTRGSHKHSIRLDGDLRHFGMEYWRLADHPIRDINMKTNGLIDWDTEKKVVQIHLMRIGLNDAFMDLHGSLDYFEKPIMKFQLSCREMPIQSALDAIPKDFIPVISGARVMGTLDMTFDFAVDLDKPRDLTFDPKIEVKDFYVVQYPEKADIRKRKGPFKHVARKKGKVVKEFMVGPSNPDFVPYEELGHYAIRGVLTCEDGRFFRHSGFQLKHIRASLVRNLKEKRFARGGSTISMQTTKNLFLSGKKNLSRKFQEMLLTYAMEQELTKERILEIYMNIIEWGPELYGIGPAAKHYFGKSPASLKPIEAAFLGSIIANPVRYHYMFSRGDVTDSWSIYLQTICSKMGIGPDAYKEAEPYRPEFGWVRKKRLAEEKKAKEEAEKLKKEQETDSLFAIPVSTFAP